MIFRGQIDLKGQSQDLAQYYLQVEILLFFVLRTKATGLFNVLWKVALRK